jgi:DNA polymerase I
MPETLVWDIETNGLLPEVTTLHSIQIGTPDGTDVDLYCDALPGYRPLAEGLERLAAAEKLIGHNVVAYDMRVLDKLHPGTVRLDQMIDTMILARLMDPNERDNRLEAWGQRLGVAKGDFSGPWHVCTPEMMNYAAQDIVVTRALWNKVKHVMDWGRVVDVEHKFQFTIALQESTGFRLDVPKAEALAAEYRGDIAKLDAELQKAFPPIAHEWIPKASNSKLGYVKGQPVTKWEVFSPGSRQQCVKRLEALGWKPRAFGKDGIATLDDDILRALPHPQAQLLADRFTLEKRLGQLSDGKTGWLRTVKPDGRVYGRVNTIGCAPGRCSHNAPNLANVNKQDKRMRGVWIPRDGWKLVGIDAEGLQARLFAHYVARYDGGEFARKLTQGSKKDRTDVHSSNLAMLIRVDAFLCPPEAAPELWDKCRDGAKRCLYATWFGAQDPKLGWTAKDGAKQGGLAVPRMPDRELGKLTRAALMQAIKGYEPLVKAIQATAKEKKYLRSPLGRRIPIRSMHSALVFLEQGGEADVMKLAETIFYYEAVPDMGWRYGEDFAFVAHVHDERQIECRPEIAEQIGQAYAACISLAGLAMKLRCPLAGSYHVGDDWSATH